MSLASADLPSDPDALRAFALACQGELAAATAELQAAKLAVCRRKLKVLHHARRDTRYICNREMDYASDKKCIAFNNMRVDAAVSAEVLRAISPLGLDAALQLIADREQASGERLRQSEMALQQARYEVTHARRQYEAVDPDNRLVASELERRWNERLAAAARLEEQIRSLQNEQPRVLCDDERAALLGLADDFAPVMEPSGRVQRN